MGRREQPEHPTLNDVARTLFGLEIPWLRRRDFPVGVSLAAVAQAPG